MRVSILVWNYGSLDRRGVEGGEVGGVFSGVDM